ncbi:MAG: HRDC domain-containing protein, partial [Archangium sp.]
DARNRFERLVGGMVRAGQLRQTDDVFEKDGKRIPFTRLHVIGSPDPSRAMLAPKSQPTPERTFERKTRHRKAPRERSGVELPSSGASAGLVERLRAWRLSEAKRRRVPAFRVLTNRALVAVAEARPSSATELRNVEGLGPKVIKDSGAQLLALCRDARL